ncbi:MAG: ABC transporter permease, partial [Acidobacteriaceae bacterium]|nr:ABC transporter permease [Acidobacteriaceae bacterium]
IAWSAMPLLGRLVPVALPLDELPSFDTHVLLFAGLVTFVTGIGFGLLPALRTSIDTAADLQERGRTSIGARGERLRASLVVLQVACSIVLLTGCGLLTRALWRIQAVPLGIRVDHVLTVRTSLPMPRYETAASREPFYRRVLEETRRLPGVTAAAYTSFLPVAFGGGIWPVEIAGKPEDIAHRRTASMRFVTPGYFQTMGIPLLQGRDIAPSDSHDAAWVAVVSKSFTDRYWPQENALGRHFDFGNHDRMIIGVAGDVKIRGPERLNEPQVYLSWLQPDNVSPWYAPKDLMIRTTADPSALIAAVRQIIHSADPLQPVSDARTMTEVVEEQTAPRRVQLAALGAFGAIALLLAAVGIHGLLSFAVSTRTQEIGVRLALGAQRSDILSMTLRDGLRLSAIGSAIGLMAAYAAGRFLEALLAGVSPWDLPVFGVAAALSFLVALAGGLAPALRATDVDPVVAMRAE